MCVKQGCKNENCLKLVCIVFGWQVLSVLLAGQNITSQILTDNGWKIPTLMNVPLYLLLFIIASIIIFFKNKQKTKLTYNHHSKTPLLTPVTLHVDKNKQRNNQITFCPNDPYLLQNNDNNYNNNNNGNDNNIHETMNDTMQHANLRKNDQKNENNNSHNNDKIAWFYYLMAALCDCEGTTLILFAYRFTNITSITLLDFFTIPVVIFLTWFVVCLCVLSLFFFYVCFFLKTAKGTH